MTKREFLTRLERQIPEEEREEQLAFYSEMIDDRMEEGMSEEEAVASIGVGERPEEVPETGRQLTAGEITLLVLAAPLLISAAAVVLSAYISLWSVIVSMWAVFGSLVACGVCVTLAGIVIAIGGYVPAGLALTGAGLICAALSVFAYYGCYWATKGTVLLTKTVFSFIRSKFTRKENGQ